MIDLLPCIALLIACVLVGTPHIWRAYEAPKEWVVVLAGLACAIWWGVQGSSQLGLPTGAVWVLGGMFMLWGLRCLFTKFPQRALWDWVCYAGGMIIALGCSLKAGVIALVIAGTLNALYGFAQSYFKWEPMKGTTNAHGNFYAIGFIGNENMLGTFLVPVIFLNLGLVAESWLWFGTLAVMLVTLVRTHCKTAMIGLVGGALYVPCALGRPEYAVAVGGCLWLVYLLVGQNFIRRGPSTMNERLNYWKIAYQQICKTPLLGTGFSEFQNNVCFLQRELNNSSEGEFLKRENYIDPWPRRCHCDFLQHIVDHGVVGAVLVAGWVLGAMWWGVGNQSWQVVCTSSALAGLLVCGVGFHTFYVLPTNLVFWFLTLSLWKLGGSSDIAIHGKGFLYVAIPLGLLALVLGARQVLFEVGFQKFLRTGSPRTRDWLLELFPQSAVLHDYVSINCAGQMNVKGIIKHSAQAIAHYDGVNRLWEAYANLGSGLMMTGALNLSEMCYKQALSLWPSFERGQKALKQLDEVKTVMQSGKGVVLHYEQNTANKPPAGEVSESK